MTDKAPAYGAFLLPAFRPRRRHAAAQAHLGHAFRTRHRLHDRMIGKFPNAIVAAVVERHEAPMKRRSRVWKRTL
ncbi:hypothetical protein [Lysobacter capsici]|uniref:hypothetical protein n=1 Tax=Lysobacter capsici TaxID=435897 RepID=UPI001290679E|nr:hypothetical protein [Lysobacter capsici]WND82623.1 hypothetical protein RJ610_09865 [Lysobacter capsici]WND87820.1 hypothetical protein RJ609_09870 [Lysobacter capsici]